MGKPISSIRIGGFIIEDMSTEVVIRDVGGQAARLSLNVTQPLGSLVRIALQEGQAGRKWLWMFCVAMYSCMCAPWDGDGLVEVTTVARSCAERHAEMYGGAEDDEANLISTQKAVHGVLEQARKEMSLWGRLRSLLYGRRVKN